MTLTYDNLIDRPRTNNVNIAWIEPSQRLVVFTLDSGAVYYKDVQYFAIAVRQDGTELTEGSSSTLNAGEFYYDSSLGRLYVRMSDDSNPNTKKVVADYRLFLATAPEILPYDLDSGAEVEYEGRMQKTSPITKDLDEEQVGVAIESSTSINIINADGYFDLIYDTLVFENKRVRIYSWSPLIPLSEKQLVFDGIIQDKKFSSSMVSFVCKDFVFKLREPVSLNLFSSSDGELSDTYINSPKRRIYGRVQGVECIPIDNTLDGYTLTGTITGTLGSTTVTGSGTSFLDEVTPDDELIYTVGDEEYEVGIESVDSDTQITISDQIESAFTSISGKISPKIPYRKKNRRWNIAGHKLRQPTTTVSSVDQLNRFSVADGSDIFANDIISVDGENARVKRISGNNVVLKTNLQTLPSVSDPVIKNPLSAAYINDKKVAIDRDWTIENTTEAILVLDDLAEFNITKKRSLLGTWTFSNASRTVTATGVDPISFLKPRDWIRSDDVTHTTWYEILDVSESGVTLRVAYAGANTTGNAERKNVSVLEDDALVTVDCIGYEDSGNWIKTASDAVKHLVENDAGITNTNSASFSDADVEAPQILSLVIPSSPAGQIPKIRDVITDINKSVFGSLVNNTNWELVYNILSPEKPSGLEVIRDDDIVGEISVQSKNEIVRKVNVNYRPFKDRFLKEDTFKLYEFTNDFVDTMVGTKREEDIEVFLYEDADAQTIGQRYALFNSLSQSLVTLKAKMKFMLHNLNDKVSLELDRLYGRFGNSDRKKIGIINKITKNGNDTSLEINDLGNIFNRVPSISENTASEFTSADSDEKIMNGYIVDDTVELPDTSDDSQIYTQIIG